MSLGANIRERRKKKRLTQMQLAKRSGMGQTQISRLESGSEANTTLESIRRIAFALGCSVVDLLPEEDKRRRATPLPAQSAKSSHSVNPTLEPGPQDQSLGE